MTDDRTACGIQMGGAQMRTPQTTSSQGPCSSRRPLSGAAVALLVCLLVLVVLVLPHVATSGALQRPVYQAPQGYYLALGDSITYGFQPTKAKAGARPSVFRTGFVDVFAARLRKLSPGIQVVNYGCPGESTVTFTRGGCPALYRRHRVARRVSGLSAEGCSVLRPSSPRGRQPDHTDVVRQRLASGVAGHMQGRRRVRS